jgi:FkbM family methyltransferase
VNLHGIKDWLHHHATNKRWFGRLILKSIPDIARTIDVPGIGPFRIHLRRNRSFLLHDPLLHEGFMLSTLQSAIRPGDIVFDVGANIGLYTRFMISYFKAGTVVAFEPSAQNLLNLNYNIRLGGISSQVQVIPMALADMDGEEIFQADDMSSASGTLDRVGQGVASQGRRDYGLPPLIEKVQVSQIDTLVRNGTIPHPNVIKIDAQGAEA